MRRLRHFDFSFGAETAEEPREVADLERPKVPSEARLADREPLPRAQAESVHPDRIGEIDEPRPGLIDENIERAEVSVDLPATDEGLRRGEGLH